MSDQKQLAIALHRPASRLKRERTAKKQEKTGQRLAIVQQAIEASGGQISLPITANEAAAIVGSQHFLQAISEFLEGLAHYNGLDPAKVLLANVPDADAERYSSTRRNVESSLFARAERQIQMAVIALTIDLVLACPGDNVEICNVLWRIYEGYQDVEDGRRNPPWEPSGVAGGAPAPERYARRKAAVAAAQSAYMLGGLTEEQALQRIMVHLRQVTPAFFGLNSMELAESTVGNWRGTLRKGRTESELALQQFQKWQRELVALRKAQPERLIPWAERLLHAAVRRED